MVVSDADARFSINDFTQTIGDQAPYLEVVLSADGSRIVDDYPPDSPQASKLRLPFFMHFFEPTQPLLTSYGPVLCPEPGPMSPRIETLVPYEPVA